MVVHDGKRVGNSTLGNGGIWSGKSCGAEGAEDTPRCFGGHGRTRYPATKPPSGASGYKEKDDVEEIVHDEPRPQSVRILRKRGDDIVIVEEEDTTKEFRRLETALPV